MNSTPHFTHAQEPITAAGFRRLRSSAFLVAAMMAGTTAGWAEVFAFSLFAGAPYAGGLADGAGAGARFVSPQALTCDPADNLYVIDQYQPAIRRITPAGVVTTIAGGAPGSADGVGPAAQFRNPQGIACDAGGNLYVTDFGTVRRVTPAGVVSTLAGQPGSFGNRDGVGGAARFSTLMGIAVDGAGVVYVGDVDTHTIRRITPDGRVTTFAGSGRFGSADGVATSAEFGSPYALAAGRDGTIYVADIGVIRKITPGGSVTTLAGKAIGTNGWHDGNGASARFGGLLGIAADRTDTLYVCDNSSRTIRRIRPDGEVATVAGNPVGSTPFREGIGASARFIEPASIAVNSQGALFVSDLAAKVIVRGVSAAQPAPARIVNCAARGATGLSGEPVVLGFTVDGQGAMPVLARAVGPTLAKFGVPGVASDPALVLATAKGVVLGENDDWNGAEALSAAFVRFGAFPLSAGSKEAAVTATATVGAYSVQAKGSGVMLCEVYTGGVEGAPRLLNAAARVRVAGATPNTPALTTQNLAALGFVITGDVYQTVLVRAIGPSLAQFGVGDPVPGVVAGLSAGGMVSPEPDEAKVRALFPQVGAFPLVPGTREVALLYTLPPGDYVALAASDSSSGGTALLEVYFSP